MAVANAFGDVRHSKSGEILAGPRLRDGSMGDSVELMQEAVSRMRWGENTTLGVVATRPQGVEGLAQERRVVAGCRGNANCTDNLQLHLMPGRKNTASVILNEWHGHLLKHY